MSDRRLEWTMRDALNERDEKLLGLTRQAQALVGATITSVEARPHDDGCDSANVIRLITADGRVFDIEGGYGSYSEYTHDEYRETISIKETPACRHDWQPVPAGMWPPVQTCNQCGWERPV